jgi:HSP20 family protein
MSIGDWDIFGDIARLRRDLDRFADRMRPAAASADQEDVWAPPVDIHEMDDMLVLLVDLPGLRREDIELNIQRDSITLEGARTSAEPGNSLRMERPSGHFLRSFRIGVPVDPGGARAVYRDGVLRITLPRTAPSGPARVRVEVE